MAPYLWKLLVVYSHDKGNSTIIWKTIAFRAAGFQHRQAFLPEELTLGVTYYHGGIFFMQLRRSPETYVLTYLL